MIHFEGIVEQIGMMRWWHDGTEEGRRKSDGFDRKGNGNDRGGEDRDDEER